MTIDEAIAHAREVAEEQRKDNENCKYKAEYGCKGCADYYSKPCIEYAEEHEQFAEWLEELKSYREIGTVEECRNSILDIIRAYNKAIDDFVKYASDMPTVKEEDGTIRPIWLEEIAEQLKIEHIIKELN